MKVQNITSSRGNTIANQFIIPEEGGILGNFIKRDTFQSYNSIIATKTLWRYEDVKYQDNPKTQEIELDEKYWNYSKTTGKYRNIFLGETKKETQAKIDNGTYKLVNLN